LSQAQTEELMIDDPIFLCLERWMENTENHGQELRSSELFLELKTVADRIGADLPYRGTSGFGRKIRQIISNLRRYYQIDERESNRHRYYAFNPKAEGVTSQD